jgi:BON domain
LKDDPAVDSSRIAVAVNDGVVTLRGSVPIYWQKVEAAKAARRVVGVQAVANDVKVEVADAHVRDDVDIASAAATAIKYSTARCACHRPTHGLPQLTAARSRVKLLSR